MRLLQSAGLACALVMTGAAFGSAQQRPATLDDLLNEVRGLRAEVREAAGASMRAQLLLGRLSLQEGRINTLSQQLAGVRQELAASQAALAPLAAQLKELQDGNDEEFAPIRKLVQQAQTRERELRMQEAELGTLIAAEQNRWLDFNARLDEVERSLAGR